MKTRIVVLDADKYTASWPSENLTEFVQWAQNMLDEVPDQYKDDAKIEITSCSDYDGWDRPNIEISYWRDETPDEARKRERRIDNAVEAEKQHLLARLRQLGVNVECAG